MQHRCFDAQATPANIQFFGGSIQLNRTGVDIKRGLCIGLQGITFEPIGGDAGSRLLKVGTHPDGYIPRGIVVDNCYLNGGDADYGIELENVNGITIRDNTSFGFNIGFVENTAVSVDNIMLLSNNYNPTQPQTLISDLEGVTFILDGSTGELQTFGDTILHAGTSAPTVDNNSSYAVHFDRGAGQFVITIKDDLGNTETVTLAKD